MSKKWSAADISYLKKFAASKTIDELAKRFDVDSSEIRARLTELKVVPREGANEARRGPDPMVSSFESALSAFHARRYAEALAQFEEIVRTCDLLDLAQRARQYANICRARTTAPAADGAADPYLSAVVLKNRGEFAEALALCQGKDRHDDERFLYLTASIFAITDREGDAVRALARAIELEPKNRVHAFHDPDFDEIRRQREHAHLFGLG